VSTKEGGVIMKKRVIYLLFLFLSMNLFCCSQEKTKNGKQLAEINDFKLSLSEFQNQLAAELELDKDFKLTKEAKKSFLEEIIRKELLIQEAQRLKLDKKEKFIRALERYWESTLIRDLMEIKGKEISRTILVSQEEIRTHYDTMKKRVKKLPPQQEVEEEITDDLKEKKKTRMLREWINDLRKGAKIEIDHELLYKE
jgi:hypothetical protein